MKKQKLSIYVHIPFCVKKCDYCDFLSAPAGDDVKENYVNQLCREIEAESKYYQEYEVDTVFFGGGTPTSLYVEQLCKLLDAIYVNYSVSDKAEITTECNPGTVDFAYLCKFKNAGFNRLSIGLQSTHDEELKLLGRIHSYEQFLQCYQDARAAGFDNINIDLMSSLPGQTLASFERCLDEVLALRPEHISAYSLIVEEGTPFYERYAEHEELLPDEDTDREMYELTREKLLAKGYHRYEISNYSKPGYECRHNLVYWKRGAYRGFGLGSSSLIDETRFRVEEDLGVYINQKTFHDHLKEVQVLSKQEQMEEFMFLGLRCMEGICINLFEETFHESFEEIYGKTISEFEKAGLLRRYERDEKLFLQLTTKGIDVSNSVFSAFLLS